MHKLQVAEFEDKQAPFYNTTLCRASSGIETCHVDLPHLYYAHLDAMCAPRESGRPKGGEQVHRNQQVHTQKG